MGNENGKEAKMLITRHDDQGPYIDTVQDEDVCGGCGAPWIGSAGAFGCGYPLADCAVGFAEAEEDAEEADSLAAFLIEAPTLEADAAAYDAEVAAFAADEWAFQGLLAQVLWGEIKDAADIEAMDALEEELWAAEDALGLDAYVERSQGRLPLGVTIR